MGEVTLLTATVWAAVAMVALSSIAASLLYISRHASRIADALELRNRMDAVRELRDVAVPPEEGQDLGSV